ncbi:hypothetical protein DTO282F9_2561 [Paecilomyces variotii]|nr:hypothetical protein DTO282F9_2561 [Paecilomyces variotii]
MQPNHYPLLGHVREGTPDSRPAMQMTRDAHQPSREPAMRSRNQATRSEDSWIEVSSQPSSSSLSSAATNDDIVTTGLRVEGPQPNPHNHRSRRRRLEQLAAATAPPLHYSREPSGASSSQDEYEESSSESDRVMTSSNEDITAQPREPLFLRAGPTASDAAPSSDEDDDDDNSTALGMRVSSSPFVPQPNAFTHPPVSQTSSRTRPADVPLPSPTVISSSSRRTATRHNSYSSTRTARRQQHQHSPYNMISPSYQADHDAALRASLSTLLSYATAARGLPKNDTQPHERSPAAAQPSTFRLVPESVAMGEDSSAEEPRASGPSTEDQTAGPSRLEKSPGSAPRGSSNASSSAPKQKRRTSSKDRSSAHASPSKKSRRANLTDSVSNVSPTLVTWVISAGVVVLFSAISFSAGYALGREVGRTEGSWMGDGGAGALSGSGASNCGREAVKGGLKRLRWSAAAGPGISA